MRDLQLRAYAVPWQAGIEFLLRDGNATAEPIVMKERVVGEMLRPAFVIDMAMAQVLIDDLWNAGLRPTEGSGSAGALAATQKHLEDMRKLVFEAVVVSGLNE